MYPNLATILDEKYTLSVAEVQYMAIKNKGYNNNIGHNKGILSLDGTKSRSRDIAC